MRLWRGPFDRGKHTSRRRLDHRALLALAGALLFFTQMAIAGVTASISGTVRDSTGAAMLGATVTARNTDTSITETRVTNDHGFYSFQALPLGRYDIEVQQVGFQGLSSDRPGAGC
jgi:hypothetical protein